MRLLSNILLIFVITLFFSSCDKESSCLKGKGNNVSEQRALTGIVDQLTLDHNINLVLKEDSIVSLTVEGPENLLPKIRTELESNILKIFSENKCSYLRSYDYEITVYLSVPNLKKIDYTGFGNITSEGVLSYPSFTFDSFEGTGKINLLIDAEELSIRQHNGPADFTISGNCKNTYVYTLGNGWFFLQNLQSDKVHVNHAGTGDIFVTANQTLLVELYAIGNVYYFGNPTLSISHHTGSGEIKKK